MPTRREADTTGHADHIVTNRRAIRRTFELVQSGIRNGREVRFEVANLRRTLSDSYELLRTVPPGTPTPPPDASQGSRTFAAVRDLIAEIDRQSGSSDALGDLINHIKAAIPEIDDPVHLMGVLLESLIQVMAQRVPRTEWQDTLSATCALLVQRAGALEAGRDLDAEGT